MTQSTKILIGLLSVFVLSGCATSTQEVAETSEEKTVIEESETTTAVVEKCPAGTTEWCVRRFRTEKCRCVETQRGRDVMERIPNPDWHKRR